MRIGHALRRCLAGVACALLSAASAAEAVVCTYSYGGESRELVAVPVASPYGVPAIAVGSYFKFRVVFRTQPADLAAIKVYTYADRDDGPTLIHQASFPYPSAASAAPYGFTGAHSVYEPLRDGELQYWCRMEGKAP